MPKLFFPDPLVRGMDPLLSRLCINFFLRLLYTTLLVREHSFSLCFIKLSLLFLICIPELFGFNDFTYIHRRRTPPYNGAIVWTVFRIRDILVRIRILRSIPLTTCRSGRPKNGSGSGSATTLSVGQNTLFSSDLSKRSQFFPSWIL